MALIAFETGLLSLAFAAWRPRVVEPAMASLVSFWSATCSLARPDGDVRVLERRRVALSCFAGERAGAETAGKLLNGREVGGDDLARCRRQVGERRLLGGHRGSDRFVGRFWGQGARDELAVQEVGQGLQAACSVAAVSCAAACRTSEGVENRDAVLQRQARNVDGIDQGAAGVGLRDRSRLQLRLNRVRVGRQHRRGGTAEECAEDLDVVGDDLARCCRQILECILLDSQSGADRFVGRFWGQGACDELAVEEVGQGLQAAWLRCRRFLRCRLPRPRAC